MSESRDNRRETERQLRAMADAVPSLLSYVDADGHYCSLNQSYESWFGHPRTAIAGTRFNDLIGAAAYAELSPYIAIALSGRKVTFETVVPYQDAGTRHIQATFAPDFGPSGMVKGYAVLVNDVTEVKQREAMLESQTREVGLLYEAARLLSLTLDPDVVYDTMQQIISQAMDCDSLIVSLYTPEDNLIRCSYAWIEGQRADATQFPPIPLAPEGRGMQSVVIRTGDPILIRDCASDERTCRTVYHASADGTITDQPDVDKRRTRSILMVPIRLEGRVLGAAQVQSYREEAYTESHLRILEALMIQVAAASRNAFLYQQARAEIAERKQAEETVRWQAYHDALTGLPNRMLFQDRLEQALTLAERHGEAVAVLFLDLDGFKHVNDTLGHAFGDRLLQAVAERLADCLRAEDTLARMGGDEFTVLLPNLREPQDAVRAAQRILGALQGAFVLDKHELFVTTSIGISAFPTDGKDTPTLLKQADVAMYRAKEQGGNGYQMFADAMNVAVYERVFLESSLRKALERHELTLLYQPQIAIGSGRIIGAEALIRWRHPEWGLVSPDRFIPLAEETGLIVPMGEWILREACQQAARWQAAGHPLRVAVNLSARQFEDRHLAEKIVAVLAETGLDAKWLDLEMTESTIIKNRERTIETLQQMRDLGVRLSVDDFGTGYSSLSYLRRFPLDVLKVDRAFVLGLGEDRQDEAIVRALIDLAHALDLEVVAEGVETEIQRACLQVLGCDALQGYLFSPPIPAEKLDILLGSSGPERRAA